MLTLLTILLLLASACAIAFLFLLTSAFGNFKSPGVIDPTESTIVNENSADTEFVAEVVRIREIKPHGNADRLEVALFDLAKTGQASYEVVVRKDDYQVGQLAGYFSVDCLLPLSHKDFAFLKNEGSIKTLHRLKAARLRKVYSQGLLIQLPPGYGFGAPLAADYGVTYHSPDIEGEQGPTQKTGKAKLQPMPVYTVLSLKKIPNLFRSGDDVVVTEKIHGSNARFGWLRRKILGIPFGWKFVIGSHRVIKSEGNSHHWYGDDIWSKAARELNLAEKMKPYRGHIFYGELYGYAGDKQIQDMTYDTKPNEWNLRFFDIQYHGKWLSYYDMVDVCMTAGLPTMPKLYEGSYYTALPFDCSDSKSLIADHLREGCVIASLDGTKKAKYVGQGYLLRKEAPESKAACE